MSKIITGIFVLHLAASSALIAADEHEHRQLGAHEHGVGQLNVALEDTSLYIELISPAMNIVGFEHAPNNPEQEKAVQQAKETLEDGNQVFSLPSEAQCKLAETELETNMGGTEDAHGHEAHAHESKHDEQVHSEFHVSYEFRCTNPVSLTHLDIQLFSLFPSTEELQVQTITEKGQTSATLNPTSTRLTL